MFDITFPICKLTLSIEFIILRYDFYNLQYFPSTKHTVPVSEEYQARNPTLRHQFRSHWPLLCTVNDNNTCSTCHGAAACSHNLIEVMSSRYPWYACSLNQIPSPPLPRMYSTYNWFPDSTNVCKGLQCRSTLVCAAYFTDNPSRTDPRVFYCKKTLKRATPSMSRESWVRGIPTTTRILCTVQCKFKSIG